MFFMYLKVDNKQYLNEDKLHSDEYTVLCGDTYAINYDPQTINITADGPKFDYHVNVF
jgi:hypothetical protein